MRAVTYRHRDGEWVAATGAVVITRGDESLRIVWTADDGVCVALEGPWGAVKDRVELAYRAARGPHAEPEPDTTAAEARA